MSDYLAWCLQLDDTVRGADRWVLAAMARWANSNGYVSDLSIQDIADDAGVSKSTAKRALARLEDPKQLDLIRHIRQTDEDGDADVNLYRINVARLEKLLRPRVRRRDMIERLMFEAAETLPPLPPPRGRHGRSPGYPQDDPALRLPFPDEPPQPAHDGRDERPANPPGGFPQGSDLPKVHSDPTPEAGWGHGEPTLRDGWGQPEPTPVHGDPTGGSGWTHGGSTVTPPLGHGDPTALPKEGEEVNTPPVAPTTAAPDGAPGGDVPPAPEHDGDRDIDAEIERVLTGLPEPWSEIHAHAKQLAIARKYLKAKLTAGWTPETALAEITERDAEGVLNVCHTLIARIKALGNPPAPQPRLQPSSPRHGHLSAVQDAPGTPAPPAGECPQHRGVRLAADGSCTVCADSRARPGEQNAAERCAHAIAGAWGLTRRGWAQAVLHIQQALNGGWTTGALVDQLGAPASDDFTANARYVLARLADLAQRTPTATSPAGQDGESSPVHSTATEHREVSA